MSYRIHRAKITSSAQFFLYLSLKTPKRLATAETIYPWHTKRRYYSGADFIRQKFGHRIQKLSIDAGFTCPNRDGTKGTGGCTFCNNDKFSPSYCQPNKPIRQQIAEGITFHSRRYRRSGGYFAYFQAYTNTYAPVEKLTSLYREALQCDGVVGLIIGTRPDCISPEILDLLVEINKNYWVSVEYGVESTNDDTLRMVNRGHSFSEAADAIRNTADRGIATGAHFIIGLPGEPKSFYLHQADIISSLPLHSVKFHQLQIIQNTPMADQYLKHPEMFYLPGMDEYLQLMAGIIEHLRPDMVIDRIAGESPRQHNLLPSWDLRYDAIVGRFEQLLEQNNSWQGKKYNSK